LTEHSTTGVVINNSETAKISVKQAQVLIKI